MDWCAKLLRLSLSFKYQDNLLLLKFSNVAVFNDFSLPFPAGICNHNNSPLSHLLLNNYNCGPIKLITFSHIFIHFTDVNLSQNAKNEGSSPKVSRNPLDKSAWGRDQLPRKHKGYFQVCCKNKGQIPCCKPFRKDFSNSC